MKRYFYFLFLATAFHAAAQQDFSYQNGDIIFQAGKGSDFEKAIFSVASAVDDWDFSHVGVIFIENEDIFVLEAAPKPGVAKTPLKEFLEESAAAVVTRLKPEYRYTISGALKRIMPLMGKPYDFTFHHDNDAYYCSELIQIAFIQNDGTPLFEATPLTFKDKNTGEISPFWIAYYEKYDEPIPEGEPGSSPAKLSKSEALEIVYKIVN